MFPGSNDASAPPAVPPPPPAPPGPVAGWHTAPVPIAGNVAAAGFAGPQRLGRCGGRRRGRAGVVGDGGRPGDQPDRQHPAGGQREYPADGEDGSHPAITRTSTSHRPSGARRIRRTIDTGLCPITAPPRTLACCAVTPTQVASGVFGACGEMLAVAGPQTVLTPADRVRAQVGSSTERAASSAQPAAVIHGAVSVMLVFAGWSAGA